MKIVSHLFYEYRRIKKAILLYLLLAGPGIIVMVADNDAGGITMPLPVPNMVMILSGF